MLVCDIIYIPLLEDIELPDLAARRREREKFREVDVGNIPVMINPWPNDMARLLVRANHLRALSTPGTFAVWPAEDALHQPIQRALDIEERARRYLVGTSRQGRFKIGRFQIDIEADNRDRVEPWMMSPMMKRALNVRS